VHWRPDSETEAARPSAAWVGIALKPNVGLEMNAAS
jgi:hypothetical protein